MGLPTPVLTFSEIFLFMKEKNRGEIWSQPEESGHFFYEKIWEVPEPK
jgi:hypothetical protein